jgi:DNA-binding SARP family transcriptional activator
MLVLEPAEEEIRRPMMILLALSGRRAAALRLCTFFCHALEELGADPLDETEAVHERIRNGAWESTSHPPGPDSGLGLFFPRVGV